MTPSLYAKLSLAIAAVVLLVGATVASDYLGKNNGQFAAVGTPTCYSTAQIAALNTEKVAIETNLASTTKAYDTTVSEIPRLTALLVSQSTISAKYNEAMAYKAYVIPYNRKNYPRVFWSYFNKYTPAINSYNAMVANNATYSAQIQAQTQNQATYAAAIKSINAELAAKNAEIILANTKKCGTTTGGGGNTTKTTFIPVPSRFDGQCGITLTDGIEGPNCADADCFTEGSCSEGPGNPSCTTSSQCSSGEVCNGSICIPVQPDGGPCMSNDQCNSGSCAAGNCEPEPENGKSKEICDDIALVDEDGNGKSNCSDFYNCHDEALCCSDKNDNDQDWLIDELDPDCRGDIVEKLCPDIANHADDVAEAIKALIRNKGSMSELPVSAFMDDINNTYEKALKEKEKSIAEQNVRIEAACKEYLDYLDDIPQSSWDSCPSLFRIDADPCS